MKRSLLIAFALPLVASGTALALVAWNRSLPRGPLALTEREASVALRHEGDDTRNTMSLQWVSLLEPLQCEHLQAAGVPCARRMDYAGYAVFELDGPSFAEFVRRVERENAELARKQEREPWRQKQDVEVLRATGSRLVLIDVGRDGEALQRKYADGTRFLILPATIRVWPTERRGDPAGTIGVPSAYGIHLPSDLAARIRPPSRSERDPEFRHRFRLVLQYGRRFEPWVIDASQ